MSSDLNSVPARARIHAALGDPTRLIIVDALTLGDASPGELAALLEMPTNLVAHHVKVLTEAGLVARTVSEGDRRRSYLRLVPSALAALAGPAPRPVPRLVFVCSANSARSQLAAALWARRSRIPAASAGTRPAPRVHPRAVKIAARHGLHLAGAIPARIDEVLRPGDFVVAVCDNAYESFPADARPTLHWSVPDPARVDTDRAFQDAYAEIEARVHRLAPALRPQY